MAPFKLHHLERCTENVHVSNMTPFHANIIQRLGSQHNTAGVDDLPPARGAIKHAKLELHAFDSVQTKELNADFRMCRARYSRAQNES